METTSSFVPANVAGKPLDIEHTVTADTAIASLIIYNRACKRLKNPAVWKRLAGVLSADFELFVTMGEEEREIFAGDYISIDIPGPGSKAGNGLDWVKVEKIEQDIITGADESFGITLRAAKKPEGPDEGIAHFFNGHATSSFIIQRTGQTIKANYYGRNEVPNTKDVTVIDKLRNSIIATGALAGLSNLQWDALLKGLLAK